MFTRTVDYLLPHALIVATITVLFFGISLTKVHGNITVSFGKQPLIEGASAAYEQIAANALKAPPLPHYKPVVKVASK